MADVQPLRGLRYAPEKIKDLANVVTPPFDVISHEAQDRYYARHPYNVIRLELGHQGTNDTSLSTVYSRAAATFAEWRVQQVLQQENTACYYLYQQSFLYQGQSYTRTSLLARVRLEPWEKRIVLPHEHTRTKDKEDRLQLLRACATNFSPIMCMYEDPQGRIRRLLNTYAEQAEVQLTDEVGEQHRLHPITDAQQIAAIQDFFRERQIYIADGHHRYTTALTYREEIREQRKELHPQDAANFVMMALIDLDDPGMLVLPTHRLLNHLSSEQLAVLIPERLGAYFTVEPASSTATQAELIAHLAQRGQEQPTLMVQTEAQMLFLRINEGGRQEMERSGHGEAWNALDVAQVQRLILERLLGITADQVAAGNYIRYTHETAEALQAIAQKQAQAVILLNGLPFRQVRDVAQADERMPQKSTYLYPKLISGLVMNPLW
ncbi:DUF1015 domain-containing protein [Tengunoibacter tsumagoiensis]|uniref:Phosphatase n=1 Tax=Tengunoibacter tsumagoiensis TaxID=2014871 RepID=A0A402A2B1_9CHLR|nr:DUF1015 domain-containing protein [Tengunoibacter tsumagoiensis]GCE13298.1 phosphatase [Tengunoibacter tsumagoiensis]